MRTYLVVTNDEFARPVGEFVGGKKVCEFMGINSTNYLYKMINGGFPKKSKYKVVIVKKSQYFITPEAKKERLRYLEKRWRMRKE